MLANKKIIWFDITNVPHVNFLQPLYIHLKEQFDVFFTIRDFAESIGLFKERIPEPFVKVGEHKGQSKVRKVLGVLERTCQLSHSVPQFNVKISVGGDSSSLFAKLKRRPSITFDDNEKAPNWRYAHFSDFAFWPEAVPTRIILRQGFKRRKLYQYHGFKEDVYIADYQPDSSFLSNLPFDHFIVLRPENIQANYVDGKSSIVPRLLNGLEQAGVNVLYLPRYEHDKNYAVGFKNVFIPTRALNGLDVCYHADAVLTGAGTLAREAACLGVPAFSFYAGRELLAVDQKMIRDGWMTFSRDPDELIKSLKGSRRREVSLDRSKAVQQEVKEKLREVLKSLGL